MKRGLATSNDGKIEIYVSINNKYILHVRLRSNVVDEGLPQ